MPPRLFRRLNPTFIGPLSALILSAAVISLTTDRFLDTRNLLNVSLQVSIVAIMAIGSTVVILTGGIDLSPGSMVAVLTMLIAILATLTAYRGWSFLYNNGSPIFSVSPALEPIFYGSLLGIPLPFYYVL